MSFSNDWSISGVTGMTSLKDAYQWSGVKRLHTLGAIRLSTVIPTSTYTDTGHGAPTTYPLVDYGIGAQKMPLRLDDADSGGVQILIDNNSARMRYFTIPGYRINNKAISGVGEIYANEYENAYNFTPALMYGRSYGTQYSNAKNWNFIEYPTCIKHMCKYTDILADPSSWSLSIFDDTSGLFFSDSSYITDKAIYVEKDASQDKFFFAYQECSCSEPSVLVGPYYYIVGPGPQYNRSSGSTVIYNFNISFNDVQYRKMNNLSPYTASRLTDLFFYKQTINIENSDYLNVSVGQGGYNISQLMRHQLIVKVSGSLYTPYCLAQRTVSASPTITDQFVITGSLGVITAEISGQGIYFPYVTSLREHLDNYCSLDLSMAPSELEYANIVSSGISTGDVTGLKALECKWSGLAFSVDVTFCESWGSQHNNSSNPWFTYNGTSYRYYESAFVLSNEPVINFDRHWIGGLLPAKYSYDVYLGSEKATVANTKGSITFKAFFYNTSTSKWDLKTVTMTKTEGSTYSTYDPGSNYACYLRFYWETDSTYPSQLVAYDHNNNLTTWGNEKVSFYGSYAAPITVRKEVVQIANGLVLTEVLGYVLYCGNHRAEYSEIVNYFSGGTIHVTYDQYNMLTHRWMEGLGDSCSIPTPTSYVELSSVSARFGGLALFGSSSTTQWNGMTYRDSCYAFVSVTMDGPVDIDECYDNMALSN